jgi:serine/threonine protein phosphatase PrpC
VFDGHRGFECAEFCRRNFEKALVSLWHECATPEEALTRTFAALDEAFVDAFERTKRGTRANGDRSTTETDDVRNDGDDVQTTSDVSNVSVVRRGAKSLERFPGCTAIAALRWGARVYVANAGDCRAVVCREPLPETRGGSGADGSRWVALSADHVADTNEAERARVVETAGPDALRVVNGVRRVGPAGLAVTRCVGDGDCKPYGVIAAPEVTAYAVDASDEDTHTSGKDFALVLACDGLWDVVSNADARDLVLDTVKEPSMSAKRLGSEALARGSGDNVTVVVAFLKETNTAETVTWERAF